MKEIKTVIIVDYRCNNHCRFCNEAHRREKGIFRTTTEVKKEMMMAKENGTKHIELIGGELTIRPDLPDLIRFASNLKFSSILMATNGRMFSYPEFAKKIVDAGLSDVILSIHGHNAEIHDYLTQAPGSFDQLMRGLENLKELNFKGLGSNTTITKTNYKYLPEIGQMIYDSGIKNSEFIFLDPTEGGAYDGFDELAPKISDVAPYLKKCLDIGKKGSINWSARYVPFCYLKEYAEQSSEYKEAKNFCTKHVAPDFQNDDVAQARQMRTRTKTERCKDCKLFDQCEGIWVEYIKRYGDSELKSIT